MYAMWFGDLISVLGCDTYLGLLISFFFFFLFSCSPWQVFSSLHMGVTLHGERAVAFVLDRASPPPTDVSGRFFNELSLPMRKGDVYVSTPASIMHGVATRALSTSERSVALQCRTLLDGECAKYWNAHKQALNGVVAKLLAEMTLTMPSAAEVEAAHAEILTAWKAKLPDPPRTIVLPNPAD